jgi:tetratricopeptide (TPR) repeat protein
MAPPSHLNPVELRLVLEALPSAERQLVEHLLGCAECRTAVLEQIEQRRGPGAEPSSDPEAAGGVAALEEVFVRSEQAALAAADQVRREQGESAFLLAELWALSPAEWTDFFLAPLPLAFLRRVLDQAVRVAATDPGLADTLARHVRLTVLRELGRLGTPGTEVLARAWSITGNVRARRGHWAAADAAFEEAGRGFTDLSDLVTEAEHCRLLADRFALRGRLIEAHALAAHAVRLAGAGGQVEDEIAGLAEVAQLHGRRGDLDQAVGCLARALLRAEDAGLSASAAQLRLRLVWTLRQLGRLHDALALTPPAARAAVGSAGKLVLQALAHLHRGDIAQSEALLRPAAVAALLEGDAPLAALAVINLVSLYVLEERSASLREMVPYVGLLAEAEAELAPRARAALASLHGALNTESGALRTLVHAAAAELARELGPGPEDEPL